MNIVTVLQLKYTGSEWKLDGDEYEGLTWLSDTPKPTKKQLEDLWAVIQSEKATSEQAQITAKASAIAKLQALGLTVDEVEVAFGLKA